MKIKSHLAISLFFIAFSFSRLFAQNDIVIGGGSDVGALICEGKVYTWGRGTLSPTLVTFPAGSGTIKQVSAGSGSHFLALDCNGKVYSWGVNDRGQVGNGTTANQPTPVLVKGVNGVGDLEGVASVAGGTNTSFAILKTGEIVSWGYNTLGQLGNGSIGTGATASQTTPNYVLSAPNTRLTGAVQILAGDAATYALLKDGTVVSWGSTGFQYGAGGGGTVVGWGLLGRNLNGTPGNPGATLEVGSDPFARPVYLDATTKLSGIINIGAGDVFALALAADGHIYSWGHDSWGGSTGTSGCAAPGTGNGADFTNPKFVKAGDARNTAADDGNGNLLAVSIAAGRGFAMAVTADNKPVAWGNNKAGADPGPCTEDAGGCLGNGSAIQQSCYPRYITSGGNVHSDVVAITRADTWGYYIRQDGSIYTWGANEGGKLGINNTTNQTSAVLFPSPCDLHIKPTAKISPRDTTVCIEKPFSIVYNSGFKINPSLQSKYKIAWYKDDVLLPGYPGAIDVKGLTYTATDTGEFKVRIYYDAPNKPCDEKDAWDSIKITGFQKKFTVPEDLTYCGNTINPYVNGNGKYAWFKNRVGSISLDTTTKNGKANIPVSEVTVETNGDIKVYVEEISEVFTSVVDTTGTSKGMDKNNSPSPMMFVAYENITIDTIYIRVGSTNQPMAAGNMQWQFLLYNNGLSCSNNGSGPGAQTKAGVTSTIPFPGTTPGQFVLIKVPVKIAVTGTSIGSKYWIGLNPTLVAAWPNNFEIKYYTGAAGHPYTDNDALSNTPSGDKATNGQLINVYGTAQANRCKPPAGDLGSYFNWQISSSQKFCARDSVLLKLNCPCNKPTTTKITSPTSDPETLCEGSPLTLKGEFENGDKPIASPAPNNHMYYAWYKKKTGIAAVDYVQISPDPTGTATVPIPTDKIFAQINVLDSGTYVLRVQDGRDLTGSCFLEDSIKIRVIERPEKPNLADQEFCKGVNGAGDTIKGSPSAGMRLIWYTGANPLSGRTTTRPALVTANPGVTTYYVSQESRTTPACEGDTTHLKITINDSPAQPEVAGDSTLCPNQKLALRASSTGGAAVSKFIWRIPAGSTVTTASTPPGTLNDSLVKSSGLVTADAGKYTVIAESDKGCRDSLFRNIRISPLPNKPTFTGDSVLCEGDPLNITAVSAAKTGVTVDGFDWRKAPAPAILSTVTGTQKQTLSKTPTVLADSGRYYATAVSTEGCRDSSWFRLRIHEKPKLPEISTNNGADIVMCGSDQQLSVDPASYSVGKIKWTNDKGLAFKDASSNAADTLISTLADGFTDNTGKVKFLVTVTNGECPAVKDSIHVTRSGEITPPNLVSDNGKLTVCRDGSLSFTGNAAKGTNGEWSKWLFSPSTGLSADSSVSPNKVEVTFANTGTFDISYIIDNPTCEPKIQKVTVTVIEPPKARINSPIIVTSGKIDSITFNVSPQPVKADPVTAPVTGSWNLVKITGTSASLTQPSTSADNAVDNMDFDDVALLIWRVQDAGKVCPKDSASIKLIRKNITTPQVRGGDTCITNFKGRLIGNGLIPGETGTWTLKSKNPANAPTPAITPDAGSEGRTATLSGINLPANIGKVEYIFEYAVTSGLGTVPPDTMKIVLYETSEVASVTGDPIKTCSDNVALTGNIPQQPGAVGTWTKISGQGRIVNRNLGTTTLDSLLNQGTTDLEWSIKNGLCPASAPAALSVIQQGKITPPEVFINGGVYSWDEITNSLADTLCINAPYKLQSSFPDPAKNETGAWNVISDGGTGLAVSGSDTAKVITPTATGTAKLSWTISPDPSIGTCSPESTIVTLVVHDVPQGGSVNGATTLCENTDTLFTAIDVKSTLPVTFNWSAGSLPGAQIIGTSTDSIAFYTLQSDQAASVTSGLIETTPSNLCGAGSLLSKTVTMELAPRSFVGSPTDTINIDSIFCASQQMVRFKWNEVQPAGTQFVWYWGMEGGPLNTDPLNMVKDDTSAVYIGQPTNWFEDRTQKYVVRVELVNKCSPKAEAYNIVRAFRQDTVTAIKPADISLSLTTSRDAFNKQFCIPEHSITYSAKLAVNPVGYPVFGNYQFKNITTNQVLKPFSADTFYTAPPKTIGDGDVIQVAFEADPANQCISSNNDEATARLEGFLAPNAEIDPLNRAIICEDIEEGVKLYVDRKDSSRTIPRTYLGSFFDNGDITWFRIKPGTTDSVSILPNDLTNRFSMNLFEPWESGFYAVEIRSNVCSQVYRTKTPVYVKIYEKPTVAFPFTTFPVPYEEGVQRYTMPAIAPDPLYDTVSNLYTEHLFPMDSWLQDPTKPNTLLVPKKEDRTEIYTLTRTTGTPDDNGKGCKVSADITVIYYLPINIPNVFTPNGDGLNDGWVITGLGKYKEVTVKVFNRWGNSMFVDNDGYKSVWDGTHNGVPLPAATYYYVVELKGSPDNTDQTRTGPLTIIR